MYRDIIVIVRGAGDIASGTIRALFNSKFKVIALETKMPSSIRTSVSYSQCIYDDQVTIEGITSKKAKNISDIYSIWDEHKIPVIIDEKCDILNTIKPDILIDAILAKRNLGTKKDMAKLTIALGPGFEAGVDVDYVIETMRGHNLGRIIDKGYAMKNTGIPGNIAGKTIERVIYSPAKGNIETINKIGDIVKKGQIIAKVGETNVISKLDGLLRGIINNGYPVHKNMKIGDVDPRIEEKNNCFTISDKARTIAGSVLEIILKEYI